MSVVLEAAETAGGRWPRIDLNAAQNQQQSNEDCMDRTVFRRTINTFTTGVQQSSVVE